MNTYLHGYSLYIIHNSFRIIYVIIIHIITRRGEDVTCIKKKKKKKKKYHYTYHISMRSKEDTYCGYKREDEEDKSEPDFQLCKCWVITLKL